MTLQKVVAAQCDTGTGDLTMEVTYRDEESVEAVMAACASGGRVRVKMGCEDGKVWVRIS